MFIAVHIKAHFGVQHNVLGSNHLHQAQMWPQWTPYLSSAMSGLWCLTAASVRQQSQERAWKLLAAPYLTCPRSAKFLCPLEVHWCFCRAATFPAIVKAQPKIGYMLVWNSQGVMKQKGFQTHAPRGCNFTRDTMTRSLALQEHTTEGGLRPKKGIGTDSKKDVT